MPPKQKPSVQPPLQNPLGHSSRRINPAESFASESIEELCDNIRAKVQEMQDRGASYLDVVFGILDEKELTPNQARSLYMKIRITKTLYSSEPEKKADPSASRTILGVAKVIDHDFYNRLTDSKAWNMGPKKKNPICIEFKDTSSESDSDAPCCNKFSIKPKKNSDILRKSDDPEANKLFRRTMKDIKRDKEEDKKNEKITRADVLDKLSFVAGLLASSYSETMLEFFEGEFPVDTIYDSNRDDLIKMMKKKKRKVSLEPLHNIVTYPRLFNLIAKVFLACLPEIDEVSQNDIIETLVARESEKKGEANTASQTSSVTVSPFYRKINLGRGAIRAEIERLPSSDNTMSDIQELPSSHIQVEGSAKSSASDSKNAALNEEEKEEDSTDTGDELANEVESLSAGEAIPRPTAGDVAKATLQLNQSGVSSPSKAVPRRDRSPLPGESPLKKINK